MEHARWMGAPFLGNGAHARPRWAQPAPRVPSPAQDLRVFLCEERAGQSRAPPQAPLPVLGQARE
eukprot:15467681-Alexandrium_andersonii.AAC.1